MFYNKKNMLPKFSMLSLKGANELRQHGQTVSPVISDDPLEQRLRELASDRTRIYADTCSLLNRNFGMKLLDAADRVFSDPNYGHLLILSSVIYELKNVACKDQTATKRCNAVLKRLARMDAKGSVKVVESSNPTFSDQGFITRCISEVSAYDVIVITQDRSLSEKINSLPSFLDGCVRCKNSIKVFRLSAKGGLVPFGNYHRKEENSYEKQQLCKPIQSRHNKELSFLGRTPVYAETAGYPRFYSQTSSRKRQRGSWG